ncbi:MAG TPA: hypothetical protein VNN15_07680 [Solirubrobacterales bacterium]|nr:hypothetical protein [Solirubrobacterales bacterium]
MKKILLVIWATLAFAVLPATASAANSPEVTYPTGTRLAIGSKIRAHNVGEVKLTTDEGTYACSYGELTGTLTKNNGTEVEASVETDAFAGTGVEDKCTSTASPIGEFKLTANPATNGLPWCIRSTPAMKEDEVQIRGGSCSGEAKAIRFTLDVKAPSFYCIYERASAIKGTYSTHPADTLLTTSEIAFTLVRGTVVCPSTLASDSSMTVESDKEAAEPSYISAGPRLTVPTGTTLAVGSKLRATNAGTNKFTAGEVTYECTSSQWTGTLTKNSGKEIEADIETASISGTGSSSSCTTSLGDMRWTLSPYTNGLPWCYRATSAMASDEFQIRGGKCSEATKPIRLLWESVSEFEVGCEYERGSETPINATYTTHPEDAKLAISEAEFTKVAGAVSCPTSLKLDSTFTFERDNTPENAPLYIS